VQLHEAIAKANQILDEERSSPTVRYTVRLQKRTPGSLGDFVDALWMLKEPETLQSIRSQRPRAIEEDTKRWALESVNYNLLHALLSQLPPGSRRGFLGAVVGRLNIPPGCDKSKKNIQPNWNGLVSEFPLVAEFSIRNGAKDIFLQCLGGLNPMPGHAVLLRHLEDMIALNFTVLTESDYDLLATAVTNLGYRAGKQLEASRDGRAVGGDSTALCMEIIGAAAGIREECRKARYLYLKGALLDGINVEVNQDKAAVQSCLKAQGFSDTLGECLDHADRLLYSGSTGFDFKSAMGHLRSFLEKLHSEELTRSQIPAAKPTDATWGDGLEQLERQGLLTKSEKGFARALFTLVSDEGVHPLIAEKEYARLARNVVVEYALLFLSKLQKLGRAPPTARANP
jgi:hypothetical protein